MVKMANTSTALGIDNCTPLVDRAYNEGFAFQFARETIVNAIEKWLQDGRDKANIPLTVTIEPDWEYIDQIAKDGTDPLKVNGVTNKPIARCCITDNAGGMGGGDLYFMMGNVSATGKVFGTHANMGMGAKTSLLSWNPRGIDIMSFRKRPDGSTEGSWIRLWFDPKLGKYAVADWDLEDGSIPRAVIEPPQQYWIEEGTRIILHGSEEFQHTFFGPVFRGGRHITRVVNERFLRFPEGVEVIVWDFSTDDMSKLPKTSADKSKCFPGTPTHPRMQGIKGVLYYLDYPFDKNSDFKGTINADGVKIHWYFYGDEDALHKSHPHMYGGGTIGVAYQNEFFDVHTIRKTNREWTDPGKRLFNQFGIFSESLGKRTFIIVEPFWPTDENDPEQVKTPCVVPDGQRRNLRWDPKTGEHLQDLPWDLWARIFREHMPQQILDSIKDEQSEGIDTNDILSKYDEIMKSRFEEIEAIFPLKKKPKSNGSGARTTSSGSRTEKPKYVQLVPDTTTEGQTFPVFYDITTNKGFLFTRHSTMQRYISVWSEKYEDLPDIQEKVFNSVVVAAGELLMGYIEGVKRLLKLSGMGSCQFQEALSDRMLSNVLANPWAINSRIAERLKGIGKHRKS